MANLTFALPVTAANGPGTAVDVSTMGAVKTVVVQGNGSPFYEPYVIIEVSNDAAVPTNWTTIHQFLRPGSFDLIVACRFMRARIKNYKQGAAPVINVAANDDGASFATLVAPAGNGAGAGVDVSALPMFKSVQVSGDFKGSLQIEISLDGGVTYSLADSLSFRTGGGIKSLVINADFFRVSRSGIPQFSTNVGLPTVIVGASRAGTSAPLGIQSISGGTTFATGPGVSFLNGGGITFGIAGNTITASVQTAGGTATGVGLSAGTQSQATGAVVFSNSNNVSFGMSGSSIVTASASFPVETPFGVSAGTQSVSTGTLVFSNSNGVTFGMSGSSRITASFSAPPAETPFGVSAGTQSVSTGTLVFSNSNGITFGMSGSSQITASVSSLVFSNSNNVSFGLNGSTITASATVAATAETPFGLSAGTQSVSTGTLVFSNSNGVTFGMSGSSQITASVAAETPFALSGGTQSQSTGTVIFSNSNGVSFGLSAGTMTVSVAGAAETPFGVSAGTQSVSTGTLVFSDSNGVTFGMSGSSQVTAIFSSLSFSNLNGVSFGLAGSTLTASVAAAGGASVSYFEFNTPVDLGGAFAEASLMTVDRVNVPLGMSATRFDVLHNNPTVVEGAVSTVSLMLGVGIYTMAGSTASLASSRTVTYQYQLSNQSLFTGGRWQTLTGGTWNVTPGDYLFGFIASASTTNAPGYYGVDRFMPNAAIAGGTYSSPFGAGVVTSAGQWTALPASIHITQVIQTGISSIFGASSILMPTGRMAGTI